MLAHDRLIFDLPLEKRLKARTSDLVAWSKAMHLAIHQSLHDAQEQVDISHQDIREYFSVNATPAEQHATTVTNATVDPTTTNTALSDSHRRDSNGNHLDSNGDHLGSDGSNGSRGGSGSRNGSSGKGSSGRGSNGNRHYSNEQRECKPMHSNSKPPRQQQQRQPAEHVNDLYLRYASEFSKPKLV
jgi:hypothetical protein